MRIKRYFAADMRQAIRQVREEQGPDAVILSNRRVDGGVEIVAALDYDESLVNRMADSAPQQTAPAASPPPRMRAAPPASADIQWRAMADEVDPEAAVTPKPEPRKPSEEKIVWSQDPALVAMREEIKILRGMLESQLSGLAWREGSQRHPLRAKLLERLTRFGLSPQMCREISEQITFDNDPEHNWRQALALLARRLPVTEDDILTHGGIVALVGPTGVGKTTTVAKLAARYTLRHGPNRVALVTTDSYRIGAHQQLRTYGRILGVPVHVANDAAELRNTLELLKDKQLVLIDTAGMSQRDMRLSEQFAVLQGGSPLIRTYVVLSAAAQRSGLEEVVQGFGHVNPDGCILTKLDEAASLGEVLSVVARHQLPVAYCGDGQRVPEDMHTARANNLVNRGVSMMQEHSEAVTEEAMAFAFGGMVSNGRG